MNEQIKQTIKEAIKKLIPTNVIIEVIVKAEQLTMDSTDNITGAVKKFFAVGTILDSLLDKVLPFPLNMAIKCCKAVVVEIIGEIVQEEYDEIKVELKTKGPDFILEKLL
jgi:hypothetical protein